MRDAVDVVGLPREPRLRCSFLKFGTINQCSRRLSRSRCISFGGDRLLQLCETLEALAFYGFVNIVGILRRARSFLRRVGECADSLELDLREELEQLLELRLGLARKTDDARRAD